MRKASEICNLPVLSIQDGSAVEKIARLAVNPANRCVEYVAFTGTPWYEPPWVLPWGKLKAVGRDLVTIKSRKDMAQANEDLRRQLAKTVDVIGAHVVDAEGRACGTVGDFEIDEATGELKGLILADGGALGIGRVLTLGAQAIVVEGGAEATPKPEAPQSESDFLLGKTAEADISDGKGNIVVAAGSVVTRREIEAAKAAGALYDLVTGVK